MLAPPLSFVLQPTIYCMAYKITEQRLRALIREELQELACHAPDGRWAPCVKGNVMSVLDTNTRIKDPKLKGKRGTIKGKNKDGSYKLAAKYGSNQSEKTSAGRKTMSGEDISPKYYVGSRYKKKYNSEQKLKEQVLSSQHTALQQWLASQDSNANEDGRELIQDSDCDCAAERRQAYQKGQQAVMYWIAQYEKAQKASSKK